MGIVFENLTEEELCDLMCGIPEDEVYYTEIFDKNDKEEQING